jgi:hypothetical protein
MASKLAAVHPGMEGSVSSGESSEDVRKQVVLNEAIEKGKSRLGPLYVVASSHDKLRSAILEIDQLEHDLYWKQANTEGREILDKAKSLRSNFPELERRLREEKSKGSELGQDMDFDLCKTKLERLQRDFDAIPIPEVGNPRFWDYKRLEPHVDMCATLFKGLEEKRNAGLSVRTKDGLKNLQEKLDAIPRDLSRTYVSTLRALEDAKKTANERLKRVEGRPRWFYRLVDLVA